MSKPSYKTKHSFERRQAEYNRIREKFSDRVPVIVEKAERSNIADIDKKKYLVPGDLSVAKFLFVVRHRIRLSDDKDIFGFVHNNQSPVVASALMSSLYAEHKDEDGFLYMTYNEEKPLDH